MRIFVLSRVFVALASCGMAQSNGSVSGDVVDSTGAAFVRVPVELKSPQISRKTETDRTGRFTFSDIPPGQYAVIFSAGGFYTKLVRTVVTSGEVRTLDSIRLEFLGLYYLQYPPVVRILDPPSRTGNLVLRIFGDRSQLMSGATLTLFCRGASTICGTRSADEQGLVRFEAMEEGTYDISIAVSGYYEDTYRFFVSSGVEHELLVSIDKCVEPTCDPEKRPAPILLE